MRTADEARSWGTGGRRAARSAGAVTRLDGTRGSYVASVTGLLLFVTQVAPYRDGPAGVHGVLDQAAIGVSQVAELPGRRGERVDDVRAIDTSAVRDARALALFTIGETPWSGEQRAAIAERVRSGVLSVLDGARGSVRRSRHRASMNSALSWVWSAPWSPNLRIWQSHGPCWLFRILSA